MQRQLEELDDSFGEHLLRALRGDKVDSSASDSAGSSAQQAADPPTDGDDAADSGKHDASGKLIAKETKQSGSVKAAVYMRYFRAAGGAGFISLYLFVATLGRVAQVADDWWLKIWADSYRTSMFEPAANATMSFATRLSASMSSFVVQSGDSSVASVASLSNASANTTIGDSPGHSVDFYIGVYGALGLGVILISQFVSLLYAFGSYRASKEMHAALLVRILNAPMRFFDTTPIGRILNRFSKDIECVDSEVGESARQLISSTLQLIISAVVVTAFSTAFGLAFIPVGEPETSVLRAICCFAR
nr:hypothetical protein HK105_004512 [Polyrhizophydium stewartii]